MDITPKTIAEELDNLLLQYRDEIPKELIQKAKDNNIVILYGVSDDLAEFEGAINDEAGCYEGGVITTNPTIRAIWFQREDIVWTYKTKIEHETFRIMQDITESPDLQCLGIVFYKPDSIKIKR